jgi:hypothetical protein
MIPKREQWFIDRIGKTVYRNKTSCDCSICTKNYKNGLIIKDKDHAIYLYDCECEYNIEGNPLKYFDTKEERDKFELTLNANK